MERSRLHSGSDAFRRSHRGRHYSPFLKQTEAPSSLFVVKRHGAEAAAAKSVETPDSLLPKSPPAEPLLPEDFEGEDEEEAVLPCPHPAEDAAQLFPHVLAADVQRVLPSGGGTGENTGTLPKEVQKTTGTLSPPDGGLASFDGGSWAAAATLAAREVRELSADVRGETRDKEGEFPCDVSRSGSATAGPVRISHGYFASPSCRAGSEGDQVQEEAAQAGSEGIEDGKKGYANSRMGRSASFDGGVRINTWRGCAVGESGERESSGSSRGERGTRICTESTVGTVTTTETGGGTGAEFFAGEEGGENFPSGEGVTCREEDVRATPDTRGVAKQKKNQVKLER